MSEWNCSTGSDDLDGSAEPPLQRAIGAQLGGPADTVPRSAASRVRYYSACGTASLTLGRWTDTDRHYPKPSKTGERHMSHDQSCLHHGVAIRNGSGLFESASAHDVVGIRAVESYLAIRCGAPNRVRRAA